MTIVTGQILDDASAPVQAHVNFEFMGLPVGATQHITQRTLRQARCAADGTFSAPLETGYWEVTYFTSSKVHQGVILVPNTGGTATMTSLVVNIGGL